MQTRTKPTAQKVIACQCADQKLAFATADAEADGTAGAELDASIDVALLLTDDIDVDEAIEMAAVDSKSRQKI